MYFEDATDKIVSRDKLIKMPDMAITSVTDTVLKS